MSLGENGGDAGRLSGAQLVCFSLPAIPAAALLTPVNFFPPAYFTTELGLSLSAWAGIVLVARIWDMVTDPVVGVVCDRVPYARFNNRGRGVPRPYTTTSAKPVGVGHARPAPNDSASSCSRSRTHT